MPIDIRSSYRDVITDLIVDHIDDGAGAGKIEHRTGARPANCETADSGTLLGTNLFSDPAFGASSGGTATANAISDETSAVGGTAAHFSVKDSNNVVIFQGNSGTGSETMVFDNNVIVTGGTIKVTAFTVTTPLTGA
jgi:hypothetical protein